MAKLRIGNFLMRCDVRWMLQRQFYFFGTYLVENDVLDCWSRLARGASVVYDVGANAGIFSLAALASQPRALIHAFEPTHAIADRLRETASLNGLHSLHVHETAVAQKSGTAYLNNCQGDDNQNEGMNFVTLTAKSGVETAVAATSLDDFTLKNHISSVDLLKIDIQGFEADALRGAEWLLRDHRIHFILCELNWDNEAKEMCPASSVVEILSRHGFEFSKPQRETSFRPPGAWMARLSEVLGRDPLFVPAPAIE